MRCAVRCAKKLEMEIKQHLTPPPMDASLSLFLKAPTKESIEKCFQLLFQHRHDPPLVSVAALRGLSLGLSVEEVPLLVTSAGNLLRRVLYESSELSSMDAVKALLPKGLDSRLESLLATVRGEAKLPRVARHTHLCPFFSYFYLHSLSLYSLCYPQVLFAALPQFRDAAVDQRVGLSRLESVAWRVQAMNSNSFVASANEASLLLTLGVRDQPSVDGVMAQQRDLNLAVCPASLGALLEGMRRIKDQLGAFS